jgi:hypothetical protein
MQHSQKIKIIISSFLLLLLVILVLLRIIFKPSTSDNVINENNRKTTYKEEDLKKKIPLTIDSILYQFGIKKEWVKTSVEGITLNPSPKSTDKVNKTKDKKDKKEALSSKVLFSKEITVPFELSVAEVNIDINNFLSELNCYLTASEDAKNGNIKTEIFSEQDSIKKLIGNLIYIPSKEVKRDAAEICLVLNKIEDLSQQDIDIILSSPEKLTIVMPYDIEKSDIQAKVFDSRKDFLLILDIGSEKDVEADFRSDMKMSEWKTKIKNLSSEFNKASGIVLTNLRNVPGFENEVSEEFLKYNKNIFSDTIFVKSDSKDKPSQKINGLLNNIIQKNNKGYKKIFYLITLSAEELTEYSKQVYTLKKKGYKFRTFAEIIKKSKE